MLQTRRETQPAVRVIEREKAQEFQCIASETTNFSILDKPLINRSGHCLFELFQPNAFRVEL